MDDEPITIITPLYDRKKFLPLMICNIENFLYNKKMIDWIILDSWGQNGDKATPLLDNLELENLKKRLSPVSISYTYLKKAMTIGEKRNWLSKKAKTKYIICMDSDDIYCPEYLDYSVKVLKHTKKSCCGSPQMLFMYPYHNYTTTFISCQAMRQIHEATMCYTQKHFKRMGGFATRGNGEGARMVDGCNESFFEKTNVASCMICLCHESNSVNKDVFLEKGHKVDVEIKLPNHMKIVKEIFSECESSQNLPTARKNNDSTPETPL
jgi:hypothetical protein